MVSSTIFPLLLLSLLLPFISAGSVSRNAPDPICARGLLEGGACCPPECNTCGGAHCDAKGASPFSNCCPNSILFVSRVCDSAGPPCRLSNPHVVRQSRRCSSKGAFRGSWSSAPVNRGGLVKRHEACAVMVNGLVVLLGGRGSNKPVSVYNPKTKAWSTRNGPGSGVELHHTQCVATNGKVYIVSSWRGGFPFEDNNELVYIYDVRRDQWSTRPGLPARRRRGGGASILRKGLIYVVGGNRGGHGAHATTLGWMDAYSIKRNRWITNLPSMPDGRDHTGGALVNGQLCVAGGRDGGVRSFFNANKASVWCFNFGSRKWVKKANFPTPRAGSSYGRTCDGRLMVAGGEGDGRAYNNVDVFDGCSWKSAPSLQRARHGSGVATSACSCGQLFIPSGSGSQGGSPELTSTERFVPAGRGPNCAKF